jgi:acyl-CoA synthetase (AMP-forming)/AMP-acid ligase II
MKGYWRLPEETAAVLDDGWYRTGDVGSRDASGYLTIRDRIRDMVISGGENVYPAEVEAALASHESVGEIAVIGRPCDRWGEAVTAVVVPKPDRMVDEAELIAYARGRIAHYKCPSKVIIADELPKNAGGKVLKRVLRERYC